MRNGAKIWLRVAALGLLFVFCNLYIPIGIDNAYRDIGHSRTCCSSVIYWVDGSSNKVSSEQIAFADVETQSTADELQAFEDLYSNYNIEASNTGNNPIYFFTDTTGLYHDWVLSGYGDFQNHVGKISNLLSLNIFENLGQALTVQTDVISLDFQIGFYRLAYYYFTNYLTQLQTIRDSLTTYLPSINTDVDHMDTLLYTYLVPDVADIDTQLTSEQSGTFRYAMLHAIGLVETRIINLNNNITSLNTKVDNLNTALTGNNGVVSKLSTIINTMSSWDTWGNRLTAISTALSGSNQSAMPYQINQKLQTIITRLNGMNIYDYSSALADILDAVEGITVSFDDTDIVNGLGTVATRINNASSAIVNAIQTAADDICDAIDDKQVTVNVPQGSIANVADYSSLLNDILDALNNIAGQDWLFSPEYIWFNYPEDWLQAASELFELPIWGGDLQLALGNKMPFGLPALISSLVVVFDVQQATVPSATIPLPIGLSGTTNITLSMSAWSGIQNVSYFISVLLFVITLAMATKKLVFWNGG